MRSDQILDILDGRVVRICLLIEYEVGKREKDFTWKCGVAIN